MGDLILNFSGLSSPSDAYAERIQKACDNVVTELVEGLRGIANLQWTATQVPEGTDTETMEAVSRLNLTVLDVIMRLRHIENSASWAQTAKGKEQANSIVTDLAAARAARA